MIYESNHNLIVRTDLSAPFSARYEVSVRLSEDFVGFCKRESMSRTQREHFENTGQRVLESHGFEPKEHHQIYHWTDDQSAMLHHIRLPYGNATSLCYSDQLGEHSLDKHNVDSPQQQYCLAELASAWLVHMDYRIPRSDERHSPSWWLMHAVTLEEHLNRFVRVFLTLRPCSDPVKEPENYAGEIEASLRAEGRSIPPGPWYTEATEAVYRTQKTPPPSA